ncbi:LysM peptidoglycan-binding domain-containing protein [Neobacillus niacini]|uniref:LysM peptidoglycan-binding domain-containing protein n=1 Tax=Neobacillus niacini TaxID=86668 RepID=UPI00203EA6CD|nr:SPOR domain-containing protein [Neobacillus niacini]MCM3690884.1 SPOR domain-containing protein [Neobacillus niacini]
MKKFKRFMQVVLCTVLMGSIFYFGIGKAFAEDQSITIKKGDTLYSISKKYNIPIDILKEYNQLTSNKIIAGKTLLIPDLEQIKPLYVAVAGSFSKKSNADKRVAFLKKKDIEVIVVKKVINGKNYYRVQAGAFASKSKAEKMITKLKKNGIKDAFFLTEKPLHINGITVGSSYNQLVQKLGKPTKTENEKNIRSLYFTIEGVGVSVTVNANDSIVQLQVYPEFLKTTSIPTEKSKILDTYGHPNEVKIVSCYESAECEQIIYVFNKSQLIVQIDRDGKTVQYLDLRKMK